MSLTWMLSKVLWASTPYAVIAVSYSLCGVNYIGNFSDLNNVKYHRLIIFYCINQYELHYCLYYCYYYNGCNTLIIIITLFILLYCNVDNKTVYWVIFTSFIINTARLWYLGEYGLIPESVYHRRMIEKRS